MASAPAWRRSAVGKSLPRAAPVAASAFRPDFFTGSQTGGGGVTADASPGSTRMPPPPERLRRRAEFVRATKKGARVSSSLFTIQMVAQASEDASTAPPRFGLTISRKVAGAVGRNRIRRRLRAALRSGPTPTDPTMPLAGVSGLGARPGQDYVIVARREALNAPFAEILAQMAEGFSRLASRQTSSGRRKQKE